MKLKPPPIERRRWPRLPLAIPVFVRSWLDSDSQKESLEFATALNVSAGGMLVALRRALPASAEISLEIPSAPFATLASLPHAAHKLPAKILRTQLGSSYALVGLKFVQPIVSSFNRTTSKTNSSRRKSGKRQASVSAM